MATIIAHNILSPLGLSSRETYDAILHGITSIKTFTTHDGRPYSASLFSDSQRAALAIEGYSFYESLVIRSIRQAIKETDINVSSPRVCLVLSTTKGGVEPIANSTQKIADSIGITTLQVTVCNACISGLSALVLAQRLIDLEIYDHAIVCGCDVQDEFIISGFMALNAVSAAPCRPFDIERNGLTLGEAAATIILSRHRDGQWQLQAGCIRNDAYHDTTPSPQGEGCSMALRRVASPDDGDIAFINAHGTGTMFNDQMESKAIARAGLGDTIVNGLKGYLGHTMGAAGILEAIVSLCAANDGNILPTRGFSTKGVSGKILLTTDLRQTQKQSFIKIISGFGGCNCAALFSRHGGSAHIEPSAWAAGHNVTITPKNMTLDGTAFTTTSQGYALLKELYHNCGGNYPKFHKMDPLSQLGYIAVELLLHHTNTQIATGEHCAIVLFNSSSSIFADREYIATIANKDAYFPSPSLFIYTLPNMVLSEIAIKNHIHGETALYILPRHDHAAMQQLQQAAFADADTTQAVTGWIDYYDEDNFIADISIYNKCKTTWKN